MATTADVVPPSTTSAVGTLFSGFAPGETVNYFVNGSLVATFVADANGRVGAFLDHRNCVRVLSPLMASAKRVASAPVVSSKC